RACETQAPGFRLWILEASNSSSHSRVLPNAAGPEEPRHAVSRQDPKRLDAQTFPQRRTSGLSQINADGEKHLIRERRVVERLGQHGRQDVQRKQMSAGDVFESEQDEYERSEEHTSELQSPCNLVCRLLLEKKKQT